MTASKPVRIAMWSGPRNISTVMMRAWGNRPDTFVCDEPLYAHYLRVSGRPHPIAEEIVARYESDWRKVVEWLTGEIPEGKTVFYQKHMTHHLLPNIEKDWLTRVTNCFLIRHPRDVITSYLRKNYEPDLDDLGFAQQTEIFQWVCAHGDATPPVLDARDVLEDPRRMLGRLCEVLGLEFTDAMLSWPPGRRETDGIWAGHWYPEVETSTGFRPYRPKADEVPARLSDIYRQCLDSYGQLYEHRLR